MARPLCVPHLPLVQAELTNVRLEEENVRALRDGEPRNGREVVGAEKRRILRYSTPPSSKVTETGRASERRNTKVEQSNGRRTEKPAKDCADSPVGKTMTI